MKRDKRLDKKYVNLLLEAKRLKVGEQELIDKELKKYKKVKK